MNYVDPQLAENKLGRRNGAQNLPGNWESSKFNLPTTLVEAIPQIGERDRHAQRRRGAGTFASSLHAGRDVGAC